MVATVTFDAQSVVVITGSSRGLGLEFVRQLLDTTESHVVATARNPQKAESLTALAKQQPDRLTLIALDTGDESSIKVVFTMAMLTPDQATMQARLKPTCFAVLLTLNCMLSGCC